MEPSAALARLEQAIAERDSTASASRDARERLYEVIREVAPHVKQVDIVRRTGWTREHVRNIVRGA